MKHIALLTLLSALPLHAATIVQTVTIDDAIVYASGSFDGTTEQSISGNFLENYSFIFDQFDSSLGTLDAVSISSKISYSLSLTAGSGGSVSYGLSIGTEYRLGSGSVTGSGAGNGGNADSGETLGMTVDITRSTYDISSVRWNDFGFEGSGTIEGIISTGDPSSYNNYDFNGYIGAYSVQLDAGASYTLTYEYTAVPEPSTSGLCVLAFSWGIVGFRRRK